MSDANESTHLADYTPDDQGSAQSPTTPENIGRYRVMGVIGSGGFGTVYHANDESLEREVAIKVPRRLPSDRDDATAWSAEARMVAMLDHPHIVPVYDVSSAEAFPFFVVSKLIDGVDLREHLNRQRPSFQQSVAWVIQIAAALHHAHEKGIVHRDVKPSNILIGSDNHAWLTDFGLAIRDDDDVRNTHQNLLIGTYSYMSPEQARGEGHLVDGRADIFALGIVLYELLLGIRPFKGDSNEQLLQNIVRAEPQPLRQIAPHIDVELERICMKTLAQRLSDRYDNGLEMATDLQKFADCKSTVNHQMDFSLSLPAGTTPLPKPSDEPSDAPVVPKGLRAFDENDQSFFLKLVPGTRDADGIPEIIRRLKLRIESRQLEDSFRVGLMYGASGSGKSSLVRAGLIPLLDQSVQVVYVESTAKHTESRLLSLLAPLLAPRSGRPNQKRSLVDVMAAIRKGAVPGGKKVVVILDQFEQWLHGHSIIEHTELLNAIRQCDGIHLQAMVLIRDDFWMPATRFFHELDIRLVQDVNSTAVDRFNLRHARYVLTEFGRAYGCLPDDASEMTNEQRQFVQQLVDAVQEDGKVISIHLVVLAQMLKSSEWNLKTLAQFGGAEGVDLNFLDATFNDSIASPHHRSMKAAAQAVLAELLPEVGTNIKGQMKDISRLREVSHLNARDFEELVAALDQELRMITPTVSDDSSDDSSPLSYQLTHDFLVPPLREWLTRSDRQTPRGRAKLRLQELTQYWRRKRESRFLPSSFEHLRILTLTSASERSGDEQEMLNAATRYYGASWAVWAVLAALIGWGAMWTSERVQDNLRQREVQLGVQRLLAADIDHIRESIEDLQPIREQAAPLLRAIVDDPTRSDDEVLRARLALVDSDPTQTRQLIDSLVVVDVDQVMLICDRLHLRKKLATELLSSVVQSHDIDELGWLRAALALAQFDPQNSVWEQLSDRLARTIVNQRTPLVVELAPGFSAIAEYLRKPTQAYFGANQRDDVRLNAAIMLSKCLQPTDRELSNLLNIATTDQFELLLPVAESSPEPVVRELLNELTKSALPTWPSPSNLDNDPSSDTQLANLDEATRLLIENYEGLAASAFFLCQRIPLDQFAVLADQVQSCGYRPSCVRAYLFNGNQFVSAIWTRDNLTWEFTRHENSDDVADTQARLKEQSLFPTDITVIPAVDGSRDSIEYGVLWTGALDSMIDSRIYVGLTEVEHQSQGWGPLAEGGYVPKSNLKVRYADGMDRYSSVRWRTIGHPQCEDVWNDSQFSYDSRVLDGWHQTDVRMNPVGEFDEQDISYAAVWWNGGAMESEALSRINHQEHLARCRDFVNRDFRPVSISLVSDDHTDNLMAASVWHRPIVSDDAKDELASRQANAVIALLRLGSPESLWPLLQSSPDGRLRSFLIDRLASFGVNPHVLFDRLMIEPNESRRFAIIAALAEYRPEQLPPYSLFELRNQISVWGTTQSSAAIHSICEFLCRRWNWHDVLAEIVRTPGPSTDSSTDGPTWHRNSQGQTMIEIIGPVEFRMGSPGHEAFRDHNLEVSTRYRIPRSFAISAAEVTVAEFQRFNPAALYATQYTPSNDCPITAVDWYTAMIYCRRLSEEEGITEDQMCYPPIEQMRAQLDATDSFTVPDNFLQRTGYRLPTEAEWEYCCRALTITPRSFGNAAELLPKYAWTTESSTVNSQVSFHPVKQLLPNGFGLFDTLGNVMEWCEVSPPRNYSLPVVVDDQIEKSRSRADVNYLRGSAVFYVPTTMRSAKREQSRTVAQHPYMGLRIARTLPQGSVVSESVKTKE